MCWKNLFLVMTECLEVFAPDFTTSPAGLKAAVKCESSVLFCVEGFQLSRLSITSVSIWPENLGVWMAGEKAAGSEFWGFQSQSKIASLGAAFLLQQSLRNMRQVEPGQGVGAGQTLWRLPRFIFPILNAYYREFLTISGHLVGVASKKLRIKFLPVVPRASD